MPWFTLNGGDDEALAQVAQQFGFGDDDDWEQ
jgi:hypothetical protein